jgi:hypothetical protein
MRTLLLTVAAFVLAAGSAAAHSTGEVHIHYGLIVELRAAFDKQKVCEEESDALFEQDYAAWKAKYGDWHFCDRQLDVEALAIQDKYKD